MRGMTHAAVGACLAAASGGTVGVVLAAAGVALLPDVDAPGSKAGRAVLRAGWAALAVGAAAASGTWLAAGVALAALPILMGHRTWTHTLWALSLAGLVGFALSGLAGLRVAVLGYGSHLALDALTPAGIHPVWPWTWRLRLGLVRTGAWTDHVIGAVAALLVLVLEG